MHTAWVDATELRASIAGLPSELAAWHGGKDALPKMLAVLAMRRIERLAREGLHPALRAPGHLRLDTRSDDRFRHSAAAVVTWSSRHLRDEPSIVPPPVTSQPGRARRKGRRPIARGVVTSDFEAACDLASDWQELEMIEMGLATGDLTIREAKGRHVWLANHRRSEVEVLDIVLAQVTVLDEPAEQFDIAKTRAWFEANRGRPERVHSLPESIRRSAWEEALALLRGQGTSIPETTHLGGVTLAEARSCYALLIAQLYLNEFFTIQLGTEQTLVWGIKPANLAKLLGRYVDERAATAFIELCRYVPGRSPVAMPLIPHRELLLIPSALVSPIAFERTLLRAASADPSGSGPLGKILGDRARRWAERLGSIPGCEVAERVKVQDRTGKTLGDLDIVARDRDRRLAVVFETKWPVDAATLAESYKVDSHFTSGREQLKRLRTAIVSGDAVVRWPRNWELSVTETDVRWWVGSAQQLDSSGSARADGIGSTSLRLVEHLLPQPSLTGLVEALEQFPMPRLGIEFDLVPQEVSAGPYVLHFDALHINGMPLPPPDRRTSGGWT